MTRFLPLFLAIVIVVGCSRNEPIPEVDLALTLFAETHEVEFGKAFPLTVTRIWSKGLLPESWNDRALAPLTAHLKSCTQREDAVRIEEKRHYSCYAFAAGKIVVPAPRLGARIKNSNEEQQALGNELVFTVLSSLSAETQHQPEYPGKPMQEPFSWNLLIVCAILLIIGVGSILGYLHQKYKHEGPARKTAPAPPHVHALSSVEKLRAFEPKNHEETQAFYVRASLLLRNYIEARFAVHAPGMTTEELANAMDASRFQLLSAFMTHCDLVKFGRYLSTVQDRTKLLDTAVSFIEQTQSSESQLETVARKPAPLERGDS